MKETGNMNRDEISEKIRRINENEFNKKSLNRFDDNGNRIRFTPKANIQKNKAAKQNPIRYLNYDPDPEFDGIVGQSRELNETYFAEWGLAELKEAFEYKDADMKTVRNNRWMRFLGYTKEEQEVLKRARGG